MRALLYPSYVITMGFLLLLDIAAVAFHFMTRGGGEEIAFGIPLLFAFTVLYFLWLWYQCGARLLASAIVNEHGVTVRRKGGAAFSATWEEIHTVGEFVAVRNRGATFVYFTKREADIEAMLRSDRRSLFRGSETLLLMELPTTTRGKLAAYFPRSEMIHHGNLMG